MSEPRPSYAGALLRYRVMAYLTGTALLSASIFWLLAHPAGQGQLEPVDGWLWTGHGFLFLLYVISVINLAMTLRWPLLRLGLVVIAGVVPLLTFFAERYVVRMVHSDSARRAARRAAAVSTVSED